MSVLTNVYGVTEQLFHLVSQPMTKDHRDECIQQITSLLEKREQMLTDVHPPFTAEDKQLFQQMIDWNKVIAAKFIEIKQHIQQDIIQLKKSKTSNQQYVNPYQNVSAMDGMFYDKRK